MKDLKKFYKTTRGVEDELLNFIDTSNKALDTFKNVKIKTRLKNIKKGKKRKTYAQEDKGLGDTLKNMKKGASENPDLKNYYSDRIKKMRRKIKLQKLKKQR